MQRPDVRIVQQQEITNNVVNIDINSQEAYALMSKYGISSGSSQQPLCQEPVINDPNKNLTFEEMVAMEEKKIKQEKERQQMRQYEERNRPHAITFDDKNVQYYNTNFKTTEEGFGFHVQVVTNMKF